MLPGVVIQEIAEIFGLKIHLTALTDTLHKSVRSIFSGDGYKAFGAEFNVYLGDIFASGEGVILNAAHIGTYSDLLDGCEA